MLSPIRRALVRQVRATFNDQSRGEKPVPASDEALFPRGSVVRRVHGDVTSMMVGGIAALLTQMLHPKALAGVWDHSDVAGDPLARRCRTLHRRHLWSSRFCRSRDRQGERRDQSSTLPDGTDYRATDPWLLAWVHVAGAINFLDGWRRAEPRMGCSDRIAISRKW
jgi:uncharacterized protein (DUF2236 family)